jgi:hypothetical protein
MQGSSSRGASSARRSPPLRSRGRHSACRAKPPRAVLGRGGHARGATGSGRCRRPAHAGSLVARPAREPRARRLYFGGDGFCVEVIEVVGCLPVFSWRSASPDVPGRGLSPCPGPRLPRRGQGDATRLELDRGLTGTSAPPSHALPLTPPPPPPPPVSPAARGERLPAPCYPLPVPSYPLPRRSRPISTRRRSLPTPTKPCSTRSYPCSTATDPCSTPSKPCSTRSSALSDRGKAVPGPSETLRRATKSVPTEREPVSSAPGGLGTAHERLGRPSKWPSTRQRALCTASNTVCSPSNMVPSASNPFHPASKSICSGPEALGTRRGPVHNDRKVFGTGRDVRQPGHRPPCPSSGPRARRRPQDHAPHIWLHRSAHSLTSNGQRLRTFRALASRAPLARTLR